MRGLTKMIGGFLVLSFLMAHLLLISLFLAPASKLVGILVKSDFGFLDASDIPTTVTTFIITNKIDVKGNYNLSDGLLDRFILGLLKIRKNRLMNTTEQLALDMNLLDYGENIVGLGHAADFYYKKSLDKLTDQEWITLINLQKIFSKK